MIDTRRLAGLARLAALFALVGAIAHPLRSTACSITSDCAFDSSLGCGTVTCNHSTSKCQFTGDPSIGQPCTTAAHNDGTTICAISSSGGTTTMSLQCRPPQCTTGQQKCGSDSTLSTCSSTGEWNPAAACPSDKPQCDNGACSCPCADGAKRCNAAGTAEQVCSGCKWGPDSPCATGICGGNKCAAVPACKDGEHKCTSAAIQVCVDGQWKLQQRCLGKCACGCAGRPCPFVCKPPSVCVDGKCQRVDISRKCVPACGKGEVCIGGECVTRE